MLFTKAVVTVLTTVFFGLSECQIEVIPVRAGIYGMNHKYIKWGRFFVNRYNRKSLYYANLEGEIIQGWNNNVTLEAVFYEKLGNEYKRSFVEMKFPICDLVNKDAFLGPTIRATGFTCPAPNGVHHLMNLTMKKVSFPYKMPFEYARVDGYIVQTKTGDVMGSGYIYVKFKQMQLRKTKLN